MTKYIVISGHSDEIINSNPFTDFDHRYVFASQPGYTCYVVPDDEAKEADNLTFAVNNLYVQDMNRTLSNSRDTQQIYKRGEPIPNYTIQFKDNEHNGIYVFSQNSDGTFQEEHSLHEEREFRSLMQRGNNNDWIISLANIQRGLKALDDEERVDNIYCFFCRGSQREQHSILPEGALNIGPDGHNWDETDLGFFSEFSEYWGKEEGKDNSSGGKKTSRRRRRNQRKTARRRRRTSRKTARRNRRKIKN